MSSESTEYDIIFAGGGTTACVAAGRLSAADDTLRILIIENGELTHDKPFYVQPGRYMQNMMSLGEDTFTVHAPSVSINANGRSLAASNAKCVGGGGSINGTMYTRAAASDYDDWKDAGNQGWGSEHLIPLAKKPVSYGGCESRAGKDFLAAAAAYGHDRSLTDDANDFVICNVYIDAETGRRSDAAHFYVYNQAHNPNLEIRHHARVTRVLFDNENRAVGVEYLRGRDGPISVAFASRLVVVSAGAFCSAAILQRSGIGTRSLLHKFNIPVVVDLPGVGENYQDHTIGLTSYLLPAGEVTLTDLKADNARVEEYEKQWHKDGKGLFASNAIDAGIKIRPDPRDLEELRPIFKKRWEEFFLKSPDKPIAWIGSYGCYVGSNAEAARRPCFTMMCLTMYPVSLGHIEIQSPDPYSPLKVTSGLLDNDQDLMVLRWAYKWSRELARRMDGYRGEFAADHPNFPAGSKATCAETSGPVEISAPEIHYTKEDSDAIDVFYRATTTMAWHALGTCAMKPREQLGVVDPRLNVHGVKNLKVADMSIAPLNVGGNTYNTALIIGEKAALIIAEELGIEGV
ncbi:hypothetical protein B0H10DRAFT_2174818 [Mycena sp. CBHHK59/15]|nr:hypothetical protein B0H10DRAFT_2174818 [Mycena sp. CBHHK59/15]